jgi:hypothetical protein
MACTSMLRGTKHAVVQRARSQRASDGEQRRQRQRRARVRARTRRSYLGSCKLLRQMAHVSVTTFQDHTATAFHFFILMKGLLSWNAGSPGLGTAAAAAAEAAAEEADAEAAAAAEAETEDSVGVLATAALPSSAAAAAASSDARADARVVRCRFVGLLSAIQT